MRRAILVLFILLVLPISVRASSDEISTVGKFKTHMRYELSNTSSAQLPDSLMSAIARRAIRFVSENIGGVPATIMMHTDTDQAFFAIHDSVTYLKWATIISGDRVRSIKSWYPPLYVDKWPGQDQLVGVDEEQTPKAMHKWGDTLQLMPAPSKIDSIYLKCYVKHPIPVGDTSRIFFETTEYTEAAVWYACKLACEHLKLWDEAAYWRSEYQIARDDLRQRQVSPIDLVPNGGQ